MAIQNPSLLACAAELTRSLADKIVLRTGVDFADNP